MGMPWENQPDRRGQSMQPDIPLTAYDPRTGQQVTAMTSPAMRQAVNQRINQAVVAGPPQQPGPAPAVVARNVQTGEKVPVDLNSVIQQAINSAIVESRQQLVDGAESAKSRFAKPKKKDFKDETVEEAFQSGQVTTLTFIRGISLDIGVSLVAAFATIANGPGFSVFDKELWMTVIPALVAKTFVQTFISFATKVKMQSED